MSHAGDKEEGIRENQKILEVWERFEELSWPQTQEYQPCHSVTRKCPGFTGKDTVPTME